MPELNEQTDSFKPDQFVGKLLEQKYDIEALVGQGGMSSVYRARHVLTDKVVAVKTMNSHLLVDPTAVRRFQQEATASSRLTHENAISVHDFGVTEDGQPFLVMDFLEGKSLSEVIASEGRLDPWRALMIFLQACNALENAHHQRIIHRDLKPSNIMLIDHFGNHDFVKVVDFGIAKILPQEGGEGLKLTTTGEIFGSPLYMSPEQCLGQPLNARSDIYSFGCLMYETLTGKAPLEGKNLLETMYKQMNEEAPPLKGLDCDVRIMQRLDAIIKKCLAKTAGQRYASFAELARDLEALIRGAQGSKALAKMQLGSAWASSQIGNKLGSSKKLVIGLSSLAFFLALMVPTVYLWKVFDSAEYPSKRSIPLLVASPDKSSEKHARKEGLAKGWEMLSKSMGNRVEHFYSIKNMAYYYLQRGDWNSLLDTFSLKDAQNPPPQIDPRTSIDYADLEAMVAVAFLNSEANASNYRAAENYSKQAIAVYEAADAEFISNFSLQAQLTAGLADWRQGELLVNGMERRKLIEAKKYLDYYYFLFKRSTRRTASINVWSSGLGLSQVGDFYVEQATDRAVVSVSEPEALHRAMEIYEAAIDRAWNILDDGSYNKGAVQNQEGLVLQRLGKSKAEQDDRRQKDFQAAAEFFDQAYKTLADAGASNETLAIVLLNESDAQLSLQRYSESFKNRQRARAMLDFVKTQRELRGAPAR